jgi:hypothetical protein
LTNRLGRPINPKLADLGRLLWFDTITNEALPQTNESWLVLNSVGRAPLVPVW